MARRSRVARLDALRLSTLDRLASLQEEHRSVVDASRDSNADDEHDPEGATIAFERAQVDALAKDTLARLAAIDAALRRIASGSYGVCVVCGRPIPEARLEALPTASTCVTCVAP
ncbi:TraR/DksA C4-type zinc finger protein [Cellulomonas sp. URHD0024]|uniref:TraR/DksA family transcriptional regulator n=1 Tax=Cellulomonas sp. URHD0024 TaxID=1302620 RepID=UPI00041432C9|nr:TraR/DksA C4-type zinc finger protein [Cellulomonas sp. URHD0024]